MTGYDASLLIHLRLDTMTGGRVADNSSHARHGTVGGNPAVVADDHFGSSLRFDGNDAVRVSDVRPRATGANPAHTITGWVLADAYPARRAWLLNLGQANAGAHHWLLHPNGGLQLGVWGGTQHTPTLPRGVWTHVAVVYDGSALACYLDGEPVAASRAGTFRFATYSLALAEPKLAELGYTGRLAGLRIYDRALTAAEVGEVMDDDRAAMAVFRRTHPLAFSLHDGDTQPVLAIVDDATGGRMSLEVTNTASQDVVLAAGGAHLELSFRPGILATTGQPLIVETPAGWSAAVGKDRITLTGPAGTSIAADQTLHFGLVNIGGDGRGGTRGTRVQLRYLNLGYVGETAPLTGRSVQHLSLVNRRGQQDIPLEADFASFHTVLTESAGTTGSLGSDVKLRITNVSDSPIPLTPSGQEAPSTLVLAFEEGSLDLAALSVTAEGADWSVVKPTEEGQTPTWEVTSPTRIALGAGESVLLTLNRVIGRHPSGPTRLLIHYRNFPGYWDGHLALTVEKTALLVRDVTPATGGVDTRVGIGTADPLAKLHVVGGAIMPAEGITARAGILFLKSPRGTTDEGAWIRYRAIPTGSSTLQIGTGAGAKDHLLLMPSGNVGVGVDTPAAALHVVGPGNVSTSTSALMVGPAKSAHLGLGHVGGYGWIQGGGSRPLVLNPHGGTVRIGETDIDPAAPAPSDRLYVNGSATVLGLTVGTMSTPFANIQAGGTPVTLNASPTPPGIPHPAGFEVVTVEFPMAFLTVPVVVATVELASSGERAVYSCTVQSARRESMTVHVLRVDKRIEQVNVQARINWIAWTRS
ncbi:LamG domain-containing protein [Phytohabitans rumicis]|uniref:LamG-like jellyroll fold domain-containing protein n=1 Tax=Phytohabitans rumicis TaxID=1076125 RepID=A0A6V8KYS4_9ACTN|nr:LamG domain-containing protein [Phytohabitans rumicis]GFJ87469.1 hypothetical protein Prum_011110 [Phytohabitans rumicis]